MTGCSFKGCDCNTITSHIALHHKPPLSSKLLKEKQDEFEAEVQADKERKRNIFPDLVPEEGVPLGFSIRVNMKEPERLFIECSLPEYDYPSFHQKNIFKIVFWFSLSSIRTSQSALSLTQHDSTICLINPNQK